MTPEQHKSYLISETSRLASTMSSGEIANYLSVTRNCIMGIVHRNKIKLTSRKQAVKDTPIPGSRQHGALSINYPKKVKGASSNGKASVPKTENAGSIPAVSANPNYAVNHPRAYRGVEKTTHSKPLSKSKGVAGGAWASGGCLAVIGEPRELRGCCLAAVGDATYCAAHQREFRVRAMVRK